MGHPYQDKEDFCFWPKAMTSPAPGHIDPVTRAMKIAPGAPIATIGSCFAQHLARHISRSGLDYFVAEQAPKGMSAEEANQLQYGVFSARYGNVYTVRQALQLFDRAFGAFRPAEDAWQRDDGRWVDAFRPQVEPDGFATPEAVRGAMANHLEHVRRVFTQSDWLVFTLGLTEGWRSRQDGAVYPLAPGVRGGSFDPQRHEFVNFTLEEIWADLDAFILRILEVNPNIRFLLTVSPVALMATYEARHVLSSTVCSKAILRVAADQAERKHPQVIYFPSYEVITSPANGGRYFEDDLRQVTDLGVAHVMRLFTRHFVEDEASSCPAPDLVPDLCAEDTVCDEEAIQEAIRDSSLGRR